VYARSAQPAPESKHTVHTYMYLAGQVLSPFARRFTQTQRRSTKSPRLVRISSDCAPLATVRLATLL
jgi:hypothetical protein